MDGSEAGRLRPKWACVAWCKACSKKTGQNAATFETAAGLLKLLAGGRRPDLYTVDMGRARKFGWAGYPASRREFRDTRL